MSMRGQRAMVRVAMAMVLVVIAGACGSSSSKTAPTTASGGTLPTALGTGVTAKTIKLGVAEPDFSCFSAFVDQIRTNQKAVFQAYVNGINNAGGINGRKVVMDFKEFCPVPGTGVQASTLCTAFTDDDHVFAVVGTLSDFTGDTQECITDTHKTILISYLQDQTWMQKAAGLLLSPDIARERRVNVILSLVKKQGTLKGKKVAVLGETDTKNEVDQTVVPGVKALGNKLGTTAILTISGSDTSAAQSQLDSFIERWKSDGVGAIFMVGQQVSSKQFVEKIKKEMPKVQLLADNGEVDGYGQDYVLDHAKTDPYTGIISADGEPGAQHNTEPNNQKCAAIYKATFHKAAPQWNTVIPGANGKTIDLYGLISDACTLTQMFAADRAEGRPQPQQRHVDQCGGSHGLGARHGHALRVARQGQVRRRRHVPAGGLRSHGRHSWRLARSDPGRKRRRRQ